MDDLGGSELAANGIDARLLDDRDGGVDLGFGLKWTGVAGALDLELLADATNTSGGQEVKLEYSYPISVGLGRLSPLGRHAWMSQDLANYTFGTLESEVARGVVDYRPGSTTTSQVGLTFAHPLSKQWFFVGSLRYSALPDKIRQSPLIEDGVDGETSMMLFFSRGL
ncbi:MAG: MipA/OmpV family protein [Ahniella sp.]|nr:MipA/OmpV family protein [Ahniella sp.]